MIVSEEYYLCSSAGRLQSRTFVFGDNQQTAVAVYSKKKSNEYVLRVQYGCLFGNVLGSIDCDCAQQTQISLSQIAQFGGVLIYFRDHEAMGLGLFEKAQMISREQAGIENQIEALEFIHNHGNRHSVLNFVPEIITELGFSESFILLTANPEKEAFLKKLNIQIENTRKILIDRSEMTEFGIAELKWKCKSHKELSASKPNDLASNIGS